MGFVDQEWSGLTAFRQSGFDLACDFASLPVFLRTNVVDEVVVTLPMRLSIPKPPKSQPCARSRELSFGSSPICLI